MERPNKGLETDCAFGGRVALASRQCLAGIGGEEELRREAVDPGQPGLLLRWGGAFWPP